MRKGRKTIDLPEGTAALLRRCLECLKPPPEMTLSAWAERYRRISVETGAEPGRYRADRAPYQREILDAMGDPHVRTVVLKCAAQLGKTFMMLTLLGKLMHQEPTSVLLIEPTVEMGESLSKDFFSPMIRDTPELARLVDVKSRYSGNTILKKNFPGGHVTIVGANSPAGLRMRPVKVLLADEVDAYPRSAGTEGDPLFLAQKRQTVFWDKKTILLSTPTIAGDSRIEEAYLDSTQEEWQVPCPVCGAYQPLVWSGVKFDKDDLDKGVFYVCERCGAAGGEYEWKAQGKKGRFVPANPGASARGFHLNTLASSFCGWREVVEKFLAAKARMDVGDYEEMKAWVNTELGETWEEPGDQVEEARLLDRREVYGAQVPDGVRFLSAGVDTQDDRFEIEVVGWGVGKESWGIRYQKLYGDMLKEQIFDELDRLLLTPFYRADGTPMTIQAVGIDTGGHHFDQVCAWAKPRWGRHVYALMGKGGQGVPFLKSPTTNNRVKAKLFTVGVDAGKAALYQRLRHEPPERGGPNYCHFPLEEAAGYDETYFRGLTAEKRVVHFRKGRAVESWVIKDARHKRNEPMDLRNYATAAMEIANPVELLENPAPPRRRPGRRRLNGGI